MRCDARASKTALVRKSVTHDTVTTGRNPLVQDYSDVKQLRYGHLMIMTDQDHDGSHIKGLIMNFLHHFYPSLLKVPGFLVEFITPIIKVRRPCFCWTEAWAAPNDNQIRLRSCKEASCWLGTHCKPCAQVHSGA